MRVSKRTFDDTEFGTEDRDDVEAHVTRTATVPDEVLRRQPAHAQLLAAGDGFGRAAQAIATPGLDLAEDDDVAPDADEVELAGCAPPVAMDDPEATGEVPVGGPRLRPPGPVRCGDPCGRTVGLRAPVRAGARC